MIISQFEAKRTEQKTLDSSDESSQSSDPSGDSLVCETEENEYAHAIEEMR